ncbi:hypothetical protein MKW98_012714 [Papaver atlanticum]|uniref:Uncharacterized protein n=1 Tax=Papaver atlanticum TaxID=357466 RepID=A0AAD4SU47_9MAGN|nr:hypothetical protein MKW98_012714 [Papaver atlanticum]
MSKPDPYLDRPKPLLINTFNPIRPQIYSSSSSSSNSKPKSTGNLLKRITRNQYPFLLCLSNLIPGED